MERQDFNGSIFGYRYLLIDSGEKEGLGGDGVPIIFRGMTAAMRPDGRGRTRYFSVGDQVIVIGFREPDLTTADNIIRVAQVGDVGETRDVWLKPSEVDVGVSPP
jgi:hypothetical protein